MCRYATSGVLLIHYVCLDCRRSAKYPWDGAEHRCTSCRRPLLPAGNDFAAPRRRDDSGWAAVAAVLSAGLRYDGFSRCGCTRTPAFRPRTRAQVRARLRAGRRSGLPDAVALGRRDLA